MSYFRLDRNLLPEEDHEAARFIENNLQSLQTGADAFRWSVDLYLHIREQVRSGMDTWRKVAWTKIAGRNGAIEAYSFSMVMELIADLTTPAMRDVLDLEKKRKATRLFSGEFPDIAGIRNSSAHPGQLSGTPQQVAEHRLREAGRAAGLVASEGSGVFIADNMHATDERLTFSASYRGRLASYELSERKAEMLAQVATHYRAAFYPLEDAMSAGLRQER